MDKKQSVKLVLISVFFSVITSFATILIMSGNIGALSIEDFQVSGFDFSKEEMYSGSIEYIGQAKITCSDKKGTYLVIYSEKLVSGGSYEQIGETNYYEVVIHNGEGIIKTFDIGDEDTMKEPNYQIELLGYRSFY